MPRKPTPGEKRSEMLTAKVPPSVKDAITKIVTSDDRTESYVTLALVIRGLAAYNRDGRLTEPNNDGAHVTSKESAPEDFVVAKKEKPYRSPRRDRKTR